MTISYRVNAGPLPGEGWYQDLRASGGRIVGEVCHFVDFASFLVGKAPCWVMALPVGRDDDSALITLGFEGGSRCVIEYVASGDMSFSKERVEVFAGRRVGVLEDFRRLEIVHGGRKRTIRKMSQDKGHRQALEAFFQAVKAGAPSPIPLAEMIATTLVTLEARKLLAAGEVRQVKLPEFVAKSAP